MSQPSATNLYSILHDGPGRQAQEPSSEILRKELQAGLRAPLPFVSPKYLYDSLGSKLFEAICELPEYYPTRTEAAIFNEQRGAIAEAVGRGATLVDLGAGNCAKAAGLFPALQPRQYVPVDISADFLNEAVVQLRHRFPQIEMISVAQDFSHGLALPDSVRRQRRLFFYPGSSIGNFQPEQAVAFLQRLRASCEQDCGLLIGVDLVKDKRLLDAAYDDALGVTAAFNLNLLRHLNRLMDADFNLREWRHRGFFNPELQRVEMHLEARRELTVRWQGGQRRFGEGERIHTESSYKYTQESFQALLERAGFRPTQSWMDEQRWFMVCFAQATA